MLIAETVNEIGAGVLICTGALTAFVATMRYVKHTENDSVFNLRDELATARREIAMLRADCAACQVRFGMLLGLARRNGWAIPEELLHDPSSRAETPGG